MPVAIMNTAQDIYSNTVLPLPASEKLRLATMILAGLTESAATALDFSEQWSEEDVRDLSAFASQHALSSIDKE